MARTRELPLVIGRSIRNYGLVIGILGLIIAAALNTGVTGMFVHCNGPCPDCQPSGPPTNPHEPWSCPGLTYPAVRLIETFPLVTGVLMVGSIMMAVLGWYLERRAQRDLWGHQGPGQTAGSQRRAVFMAIVGPLLQLLPLTVVTVAGFVAVNMFPLPY